MKLRLTHNPKSKTTKMEDQSSQLSEIEMLRANLGLKDHEIFMLRNELERNNQAHHLLLLSMERLEKTMAASYDRLTRKVDRLSCHADEPSRKRRRK
jgi:hypothetical protein